MSRVGVNILLVGFLSLGLGGAAYVLPFVMPVDAPGLEIFETAVLCCWGIGATLVVVGGAVAGFGKTASRT